MELDLASQIGSMSNAMIAKLNLFDFAACLKTYFDCDDALYLDGAISQFWFPATRNKNTLYQYAGILAIAQDENIQDFPQKFLSLFTHR